jgi:hypothetical protein
MHSAWGKAHSDVWADSFSTVYTASIQSGLLSPCPMFLVLCALPYALCALPDKHRIAITIEPVFSVDRLLIGF